LLGLAFGVQTLGAGVQTEHLDYSLAYSNIDTNIPDRDNLEGSGIGLRVNYYLSGTQQDSFYLGYAHAQINATIKPDKGNDYKKDYASNVLLAGYNFQYAPVSLRVGIAVAKGYKKNPEAGPEVGLNFHF
jgi:hypothetical protein